MELAVMVLDANFLIPWNPIEMVIACWKWRRDCSANSVKRELQDSREYYRMPSYERLSAAANQQYLYFLFHLIVIVCWASATKPVGRINQSSAASSDEPFLGFDEGFCFLGLSLFGCLEPVFGVRGQIFIRNVLQLEVYLRGGTAEGKYFVLRRQLDLGGVAGRWRNHCLGPSQNYIPIIPGLLQVVSFVLLNPGLQLSQLSCQLSLFVNQGLVGRLGLFIEKLHL